MKRALLFLALAAAATTGSAKELRCEVESDYRLSIDGERIRFDRDGGTPARIDIQAGRIRVDGRTIELSQADLARLQRIEARLLALVPEVRGVTLEAVDIAFTALSEVANGLSDDADRTARKLESARRKLTRELARSPAMPFDDPAVDAVVEDLVADLVPELVGDIVNAAVVAAFTGDTERAEALEARAERLEHEIERRIAPRAEALGLRAEALCDQVKALDALEHELDYRLPNGERLDLLRSGPH